MRFAALVAASLIAGAAALFAMGLAAWAAIFAGLFLIGELLVRAMRLADYPRYVIHPDIGYLPRPSSAGSLRRRSRWAHNALGMRTDHDGYPAGSDILLVGDSVIYGSARVDQMMTVGAMIERMDGRRVYSACGSGWGLSNELAYLSLHPECLGAGKVLMIINSADLANHHLWQTDAVHPLSIPFHGAHLLHKMLFSFRPALRLRYPPHPVPENLASQVERLIGGASGDVIWVFYPQTFELGSVAGRAAVEAVLPRGAKLHDLCDFAAWGADCYEDQIHPNAIGRERLAQYLYSILDTDE